MAGKRPHLLGVEHYHGNNWWQIISKTHVDKVRYLPLVLQLSDYQSLHMVQDLD
jgi:hypothetical protein